jgi:hypothetical protein
LVKVCAGPGLLAAGTGSGGLVNVPTGPVPASPGLLGAGARGVNVSAVPKNVSSPASGGIAGAGVAVVGEVAVGCLGK